MSHKKITFKVSSMTAALAFMIIGILGSCQNSLDSELSPEVAGARSQSIASVQVDMGDIEGEWYSSEYGETFDITDETLTYKIASWGTVFGGDIWEVTDPTATEGYIYIRYTQSLDPAWKNNFYAVYWSNLDTSVIPNTVWLSGCSDGEGKETLADAIATYTYANGYFSGYSVCEKVTTGYTKATPSLSEKPPLLLLLEEQAGTTLQAD
jgi:hypothetical protein